MQTVKLDLKTLLGFKIVSDAQSAGTLRAPKIGSKLCVTSGPAPDAGALRTRVK